VKDSRTGYTEHNFHNVVDGNLQGFFDSYLKWRVKGEMAGSVGDEE
jgi:peptide chain release factor 2